MRDGLRSLADRESSEIGHYIHAGESHGFHPYTVPLNALKTPPDAGDLTIKSKAMDDVNWVPQGEEPSWS